LKELKYKEKKIKFGTDGWRAVIAEEFTFENVKLVTLAIGKYLYNNNLAKKGVVIGYDNRFLSEEFAEQAGIVLAGIGIKVHISKESIPTPVTAFMVRELNLGGAIMITASHNPPKYNGIKFIPDYGGPAEGKVTDEIEANFNDLLEKNSYKRLDLLLSERNSNCISCNNGISYLSNFDSYKEKILMVLDKDLIKGSKLKVAVDTMYGAGSKILPDILINYLDIDIKVFNNFRDVLFGGMLPDPSENNLKTLKDEVVSNNLDIGIALDGDADRFGVIDGKGVFISPNNVISMILYYLIKTRKYNPHDSVVRTVATTHLIDEICKKNSIDLIEKPVGFKYIGKEMLNNNVIIGGEESGGLSIKGHIPEKDGLLAGLLLIEIQSYLKKYDIGFYLSDYLNELYDEFGTFYNTRFDIKVPMDRKEKIINYFTGQKGKVIDGKKVSSINQIDGTKLLFEDNSWLLVRLSGTEPLVRCYIESTDRNHFKNICDFVKQKIDELIN